MTREDSEWRMLPPRSVDPTQRKTDWSAHIPPLKIQIQMHVRIEIQVQVQIQIQTHNGLVHACLSCVISEQQPPLTPSFPSLFTICRSHAQYFIHPFGVIFHYFPLFLHYFVLLTFASHICHSYTHQDSDIFYYSNYFDSTVNDIFITKSK